MTMVINHLLNRMMLQVAGLQMPEIWSSLDGFQVNHVFSMSKNDLANHQAVCFNKLTGDLVNMAVLAGSMFGRQLRERPVTYGHVVKLVSRTSCRRLMKSWAFCQGNVHLWHLLDIFFRYSGSVTFAGDVVIAEPFSLDGDWALQLRESCVAARHSWALVFKHRR